MTGVLIFQAQKHFVFAQIKFHTHCVQSQTLHISHRVIGIQHTRQIVTKFLSSSLLLLRPSFYFVPQEISQTSWLGYFSYYYKSMKLPILLHVTTT